MTYIRTGINQPGIVELLFYKGPTGKALSNLAQTLLHGPSKLTPAERETIAAYVSNLNDCNFCRDSHAASARAHYGDDGQTVLCVIKDIDTSPVSDKMKALLKIAGKVQRSGKEVSQADVDHARKNGATDEEVHDTVLIAAAFCMYNRYVDGLGTSVPRSADEYLPMGQRLATKGYTYPPLFLRKAVLWMLNRKAAKAAL